MDELPKSQGGLTLKDELVFDNLKQKLYFGWQFKHTTLTEEYNYEKFKNSFENYDAIHIMTIHKDQSIDFVTNATKNQFKAGDTIISFTNKSK